jgi:DNA-binding SARP family transcriptional activator/predicted ATPase
MALPLEIRVLGELEILRGDRMLPLPASKKTRALLGYLVVVGSRPQPRQRLCELFWDGPDDPRAALRWSLTKIRPLVDDAKSVRLAADREHVAFEPRGATIDIVSVGESAQSQASASLDALRRAAALYRGELLEGLDLPECYRYHEWCIGEREVARRTRGRILAALVERLAGQPEEALGYARARVTSDPLVEAAHIAVMQLLGSLGRPREAIKQYESCRRILEAQLGRGPSKDLEIARSALGQISASVPLAANEKTLVRVEARKLLVGRARESATIAAALRETAAGECRPVLLFSGEPGIGKTRLLGEVADQAIALGGAAFWGRAFEAEMVRPYGAWIDVLRSAPTGATSDSLRADLAPLLPELGAAHGETDRNRLFDAVGKLLLESVTGAVLVVALDDVQWFDEASVALLHYLARSLAGSRVLIACAARAAEIDGNAPVKAMLRAFVREGRLARLDLAPLDEGANSELVRSVDDRVDTAQVFVDGGGNPLFSIELARAAARSHVEVATHTLDGLIAERLSRLDDRAAELLPWAAALGHGFTIDTLAALTSLSVRDLLAALEELERHGVLRVMSSTIGGAGYDFAHDLVRRTAYRTMSEPRRRWVHLHVARTLDAASDPEGALAGDIAHHAALGGDSDLAARAYLVAGERSLRLFAHADASRLASSGMQHVARLPPESGIRLRVALLAVHVHSNQWLKRSHEIEAELSQVALIAQQRGMHAEATRSYYLMSFVHNERGDIASAGARTLEAAEAGRAADIETRQHQLANTGRCLALIERDVAAAEEFLREAQSLGQNMTSRTQLEMAFGGGLVQAFRGGDDEAARLLERAAELAADQSNHWLRSQVLTRLARFALERGRPREALARCVALGPLVAKLPEGSEGPFVDALGALSRLDLGEAAAYSAVELALEALRAIDSKAHVAYVLNALAEHDGRAARTDESRARAQEALRAAETVGQRSEAAVARSRLALVALDRGVRGEALALLNACAPDLSSPAALSARAQRAVIGAANRLGVEIQKGVPTDAPTPAPTVAAEAPSQPDTTRPAEGAES